MKTIFTRFAKDESGATAIEYGLIATLIAVAIIAAATLVGERLDSAFSYIADCLEGGCTAAEAPPPASS